MLVSLANDVSFSSGVGQTFTYSPSSLQKVMIHTEDTTGTGAYDGTVTVQVGANTVVNGADMFGLIGVTTLSSGATNTNVDSIIEIDLGSHVLTDNEQVYVTIVPNQAIAGIDISLIVDEPGQLYPVVFTEYSDENFTSSGALMALSFNSSHIVVDDDNHPCEVRSSLYASAPTFTSANTWYRTQSKNTAFNDYFGLLCHYNLPYDTTFNYSSSATTNRILVVSKGITSRRAVRKAVRMFNIAKSQASQQQVTH